MTHAHFTSAKATSLTIKNISIINPKYFRSQQSSTQKLTADIIRREKWLIWTSGRQILHEKSPNCLSLIIIEKRGEAFYHIDYF